MATFKGKEVVWCNSDREYYMRERYGWRKVVPEYNENFDDQTPVRQVDRPEQLADHHWVAAYDDLGNHWLDCSNPECAQQSWSTKDEFFEHRSRS